MNSRNNIILVGVIALIIFLAYHFMTITFNWEQTYSSKDNNPLGGALFDKVMGKTLPNGYEVAGYSQNNDSLYATGCNILFVYDASYNREMRDTLFQSIRERGTKAIISTHNVRFFLDNLIKDTIFDYKRASFDGYKTLRKELYSKNLNATVNWLGNDSIYSPYKFKLHKEVVNMSCAVKKELSDLVIATVEYKKEKSLEDRITEEIDKIITVENGKGGNKKLEEEEYIRAIAFKIKMGKGELYVVSCPLLFCNIAVRSKDISPLTLRLINQIADKKIVRIDPKNRFLGANRNSSLRYMTEQPALRAALYIVIIAGLLLIIFTVKRRQRAIPIIKEPENKHLDFIHKVAELYRNEPNQYDIVRLKYNLLVEHLVRNEQIDIREVNTDKENFIYISEVSGIEFETISRRLQEIRQIVEKKKPIESKRQAKEYIKIMNNIIDKIR